MGAEFCLEGGGAGGESVTKVGRCQSLQGKYVHRLCSGWKSLFVWDS